MMADVTVYGMTAMTTGADADLLMIVDTSDTAQSANGSSRKMTLANFLNYIQSAWTGETAQFSGIGIGEAGVAGKINSNAAVTIDLDNFDLTIDCGTGKTVVLTTPVYAEASVSSMSMRAQGTNDPDFTQWKDSGASSTGIFLPWFDAAAEEELFFSVPIPTGYAAGEDIVPVVRWVPKTLADGTPASQVVKWGLEYIWVDSGETAAANTSTVYGSTHLPADADVLAGRHYSSVLTTLTGTNFTINSTLICRIFRDATSVTDNYEADAGLLSVGFRFPIDTIGSRTATTK